MRQSRLLLAFTVGLLMMVSPLFATRIVSISTCEDVTEQMVPLKASDEFSVDVAKLHAVLVLDQVKQGLEVKGIWVSVDAIDVPDYQIDSVTVKLKEKETRVHFSLSRPTDGWPTGNYRLDVYFDDSFVTSAPFSISKKVEGTVKTAKGKPQMGKAKTKPAGSELLGAWKCETQFGTSYLEFKSDKQLAFDGELLDYSVSGSVLKVREESETTDYPFALKQGVLTISFPEGYTMEFVRTDKVPSYLGQGEEQYDGDVAVPTQQSQAGPADLMQHFAGTWWNATTNTETNITLMADGRYYENYTASYSGGSSDQLGNQDMSWGAAGDQASQGSWTVRGDRQRGEITITYRNGNQRVVPYEVHVENGEVYWSEYYFNGELYGKK